MSAASPLWNPWANDANTLQLYRRRCRREAEEMTCAAQAAALLATRVRPGESLLDAGCGGGYYLWSLRDRGVDVDYHGIDFTPQMIELARAEVAPAAGLDPGRFRLQAIEQLGEDERYDTVLCFNVLTNSPHYALGLERLLRAARRRIVLRESMGEELIVRYSADPYLDAGKRHIRVYHNQYPLDEVRELMESEGFAVTQVRDERSGDGIEQVVDIPHRWRILLGERA